MNKEELIVSLIDKLISGSESEVAPESRFKTGSSYLIRTVTHITVGKIISQDDKFIEMEDASWIADTGRFYDCLKTGAFNEVEPYPEGVIVAKGAIVDASNWVHDLPKEQK